MALILGLESSCDETAAAVVRDGVSVQSNIIASQHDLHRRYGGVVPEIASRAHLERLLPVVSESLAQASICLDDLDAIAVGNRPGLIGSLLVGVSAAKALAWSLGKPLVGVDHVRAHLYAGLLEMSAHLKSPSASGQTPAAERNQSLQEVGDLFPALGLVISGGHTSLFAMQSPLDMHLLGRTIDDAVGEAYDKAAVILGLGFPGGPKLDKLAQTGNPQAVELPRMMLDKQSLDFSFSGLKTALLYKVRGFPKGRGADSYFERSAEDLSTQQKADLAAGFQHTAIDTLMVKTHRALDRLEQLGKPARSLLVGGGVSANSLLRTRVQELGRERKLQVRVPPMSLCLDNAAMIAGLAQVLLSHDRIDDLYLPAQAVVEN